VVITGAASGIGRAAAEVFTDAGSNLVLVDIDAAGLLSAAAELEPKHVRIVTVAGDLAFEETAQRVANEAGTAFGAVHVLLNCAGVDLAAPLMETSSAQWDRIMDVNLKSVFLICRSLVPFMSDAGASIINVSSAAGLSPIAGRPAYIASKGAVIALTKSLALDLAPAIRVNCICPGAVETPLLRSSAAWRESPDLVKARYPLARIAAPCEIARLAVFLASDAALNMTGTVIPMDGGRSMA
jgi:3-oxoacyl-[acyl-carrier protein] reductase